jgi:hypothetical protein
MASITIFFRRPGELLQEAVAFWGFAVDAGYGDTLVIAELSGLFRKRRSFCEHPVWNPAGHYSAFSSLNRSGQGGVASTWAELGISDISQGVFLDSLVSAARRRYR